jgi:tetratricopeptide (TPR) repeat protein
MYTRRTRAPLAPRAGRVPAYVLAAILALFVVCSVTRADEAPPEARASFDKAGIAREEGRLEQAAQLYRKAIDAAPLYYAAHAGYLAALRALGDTFAAQEMYADLVAKHSDAVELKAFAAAAKEPQAAVEATSGSGSNSGAPTCWPAIPRRANAP